MKKSKAKVVRIISLLAIIAAVLLATTLLGKKQNETIIIGTGGKRGMYYQYTKKLAELEKGELKMRVKETEGSLANLRLIQQGFLDIAIVQNDTLYDFEYREGSYEGATTTTKRSFSAVTCLYTEAVQVIVRKDSGIESINDLKGKKVSIGQPESGISKNAEDIFAVYGMSFEDMDIKRLSFEKAAETMENGHLDAFICTAGAPTEAVKNLADNTDIKILSFSDEDMDRMLSINPGYLKVKIPAGTYKGQDQEVNTIGLHAVVVASNDLDENEVYKITKDIYENSAELNKDVVTDGELVPGHELDCIFIPFHKGAAKYYEENGVTVKVQESE